MDNNKRHLKAAGMMAFACLALLLAGCGDDIVYEFKIPTKKADCPSVDEIVYINTATGEGFDELGGSGLIDRDSFLRDHGGSGIVDRKGNVVKQFCFQKCFVGEVPVNSGVFPIWNQKSKYITAKNDCAAEPQTGNE